MAKLKSLLKSHNRLILRILIGLVCLVLAGCVAYTIKELLSARNPESALPVIRIDYSGAPLPADHYMMDSYSWRFLTITKAWEEPDRGKWLNMTAAPVLPGMSLNIDFSFPCQDLEVSRALGAQVGENDFIKLDGQLTTPYEPGIYTYKVEADWGLKGSVLYYFKVEIRESYDLAS